MAEKMRIAGITINSEATYTGKLVIGLLKKSYENGRLSAEYAGSQAAYDEGYAAAKQEQQEFLDALDVIRRYITEER